MRVLYISIILIFLFTVSAEGADWVFVSRNNEGRWYVDKDSIEHISINVVRAWIKTVCLKNCELGPKKVKEGLAYAEYDCKGKKERLLLEVNYFEDGTTSEANYPDSNFTDIPPDSIEEGIHDYLCKHNRFLSPQA
jgi:Surface-adhesin protein E